jgi:hypothetical protein
MKVEILILHSIDCAVDTEGNVYQEWEDKKGKYGSYPLEDTVVEWYDELDNFDLMRLTMWVYMYEISTPYNFR